MGGKNSSTMPAMGGSYVWKKVWQPNFQSNVGSNFQKGGGKGWMQAGKAAGKPGKPGPDFVVMHPEKTVWIGGVPEGSGHKELLEAMRSNGGACKRIQVGKKGSAFAVFGSAQEASAAVDLLNGMDF